MSNKKQRPDADFVKFLEQEGFTVIKVSPVSKPRMTQRDKWSNRPPILKYRLYKSELIAETVVMKIELPVPYLLVFVIPMPPSWSKKKKNEHQYQPHFAKPDKDNLEKGYLDALLKEDAHIHDGRVVKMWGNTGFIAIKEIDALWENGNFLGFSGQT